MKKRNSIFIFILFLAAYFLFTKPALAVDPHLSLSPVSGSYSSLFTLEVKVSTGGQASGGVDVYLEYPKQLLKIESVTKGTAFPEIYSLIKNEEGRLRINAYFPLAQAGSSYNDTIDPENNLVAKINFSVLGPGTAPVKFICLAKDTTDSNIIEKVTVKDIIVCSANIHGSYTLTSSGGGSTPTPTPTPTGTSGGGSGTTPTPTIPVTGTVSQTVGLIGLGAFMLLTGLIFAF